MRKIGNEIRNYSYDKVLDLKIKIIRVLILKELGSDLFKETLNNVIKQRDSIIVSDRSFLEDLNDKQLEELKKENKLLLTQQTLTCQDSL